MDGGIVQVVAHVVYELTPTEQLWVIEFINKLFLAPEVSAFGFLKKLRFVFLDLRFYLFSFITLLLQNIYLNLLIYLLF